MSASAGGHIIGDVTGDICAGYSHKRTLDELDRLR
jgi:hypothetical protein